MNPLSLNKKHFQYIFIYIHYIYVGVRGVCVCELAVFVARLPESQLDFQATFSNPKPPKLSLLHAPGVNRLVCRSLSPFLLLLLLLLYLLFRSSS